MVIKNYGNRIAKLTKQLTQSSIESKSANGLGFYQNKDEAHEKIKAEIISMIESLRMIKNNLKPMSDQNGPAHENMAGDLIPIDQTIKKLSYALYFDLPEALFAYNLKKAQELCRLNYFDEAYLVWKGVLKHDPANLSVRRKLSNLSKSHPHGDTLRHLLQSCRLEYVESFGHGVLKQAGKITVAGPDNSIFVSDHIADAVHRFDEKGDHTGTIFAELNYPFGLFTDPDYNLWICDMKNCKLICCSQDEKVLRRINLRSLFHDKSNYIYPLFGCFYHGDIYLRSLLSG